MISRDPSPRVRSLIIVFSSLVAVVALGGAIWATYEAPTQQNRYVNANYDVHHPVSQNH